MLEEEIATGHEAHHIEVAEALEVTIFATIAVAAVIGLLTVMKRLMATRTICGRVGVLPVAKRVTKE